MFVCSSCFEPSLRTNKLFIFSIQQSHYHILTVLTLFIKHLFWWAKSYLVGPQWTKDRNVPCKNNFIEFTLKNWWETSFQMITFNSEHFVKPITFKETTFECLCTL